jgi:molybdate transport repressor ModE-like protein
MFAGPEFEASWLAGAGLPRAHGRDLIRLLQALERSSSLRDAAHASGLSYRYAWGLIGEGGRALGAPLVEMGRGRGARLTLLGRRLLDADARVRQALGAAFERLRGEVREILADALPATRPRLALHASHDLALPLLGALCERTLDLEIAFRGADDCLAALARGECDLAGFHVADALPRAAAAAAALGRWLDPRKHTLIHFVTREQGLIARPGSRIRGVHDLARPGVRFIHRQSGPRLRGAERAGESVAAVVASGRADAGFGLRAEATDFKLGFVPLATERYFLACASAALRSPSLKALLDVLTSTEFAERVARLPGYDASRAGKREALGTALAWVEPPRRAALA